MIQLDQSSSSVGKCITLLSHAILSSLQPYPINNHPAHVAMPLEYTLHLGGGQKGAVPDASSR